MYNNSKGNAGQAVTEGGGGFNLRVNNINSTKVHFIKHILCVYLLHHLPH